MVLSRESEEFIANLRMYLMTSGKNDHEINEIAEELRGHLEDAESHGKTLDSVTGGSPQTYLENISNEMKTDYFGLVRLAPMFILLLIAYFITGSAIRGDLSFSLLKLIAYPAIAFLSIGAYIYFFRKMSSANYSTKKELSIFIAIQIITTLSLAAVLFMDIFFFEPFYIPSRETMWVIAALGALVFIAGAIWSKTWFTLILPLFLFGPDFILQFLQYNETTELIISASGLYLGMAAVVLILYWQNKKQNPHKS